MKRRSFLKTSSLAVAGAGGIKANHLNRGVLKEIIGPTLALNAYSFNNPLLKGEMSLEELFLIAKHTGFSAVDLTAYYIPGYPRVPEDNILHEIKKMAFGTGMGIAGTGVRNNFTVPDAGQLMNEVNLVKEWIVGASKLGAPHIRVFAGKGSPPENLEANVKTQVIKALQECADFASDYGIIVGFQNHNDFIKSTSEILEVVEGVHSEWFGLMLDIGSVFASDPYQDMEKLIPHAVSWQVKENVRNGDGMTPTDFKRLMGIVQKYQYQGYFPLETLGEGDPEKKVKDLYKEVISAIN